MYYDPYKVLQNIGTMTCKLELPTSSRVHPVFHVSCLKKVISGKLLKVQTILPKIYEEGNIILDYKEIIETRIWKLRNCSISEYHIRWKNLPTKDFTWEDEYFIHKHPKLLKC